MNVIVPDASVLLKWVLPGPDEEDRVQALKLRAAAISGDVLLKVPSLWLYEVGNMLARRFHKQSKSLLDAYLSFGLEEPKWNEDWLDCSLRLVNRYQVTFYDASYHGLALVENGVFVTADKQYVHKTRGAGAVVALADWA